MEYNALKYIKNHVFAVDTLKEQAALVREIQKESKDVIKKKGLQLTIKIFAGKKVTKEDVEKHFVTSSSEKCFIILLKNDYTGNINDLETIRKRKDSMLHKIGGKFNTKFVMSFVVSLIFKAIPLIMDIVDGDKCNNQSNNSGKNMNLCVCFVAITILFQFIKFKR